MWLQLLLPEGRARALLAQTVDTGPTPQEFPGHWHSSLSGEAHFLPRGIRDTSRCQSPAQLRPSSHHLALLFHPTSCLHVSNTSHVCHRLLFPMNPPCQAHLPKAFSVPSYFSVLPSISATTYALYYAEPAAPRAPGHLSTGLGLKPVCSVTASCSGQVGNTCGGPLCGGPHAHSVCIPCFSFLILLISP